jgi:hypothetical protein
MDACGCLDNTPELSLQTTRRGRRNSGTTTFGSIRSLNRRHRGKGISREITQRQMRNYRAISSYLNRTRGESLRGAMYLLCLFRQSVRDLHWHTTYQSRQFSHDGPRQRDVGFSRDE